MKQKFLAAAMLMLGIALGASAQTVVLSGQEAAAEFGAPANYEVGSFEIELRTGFASGLNVPEGMRSAPQLHFGLEGRKNLSNGKWAVGGQLGILGTMFVDKDADLNNLRGDQQRLEGGLFLGPVVEYEWNRGDDMSVYAGTGAGFMLGFNNAGMYLQPKVGLELSRFFRMGLSTMLAPGCCYAMTLDMGIVFGGYRK